MKKRKLVSGILALCLALSAAGCGKDSQEQQAANYYQQELGLDKEDAEDLAHDFYGKEDEEKPSVTEAPKETVVEPLPELVNSQWYEEKVQVYDMVFANDMSMTEEDIRKIVAGSAYDDIELGEGFDKDGNVRLKTLNKGNGAEPVIASIDYRHAPYRYSEEYVKYGLLDDKDYYTVYNIFSLNENNCYDKGSIEFADFKTRDDVLAYLSENSFVEVEKKQSIYAKMCRDTTHFDHTKLQYVIYSDKFFDDNAFEFADVPHYYCTGMKSITFFRIHKLSESDQEIEGALNRHYSGIRLNQVNLVTFEFNTDGTIVPQTHDGVTTTQTGWDTAIFMLAGERID